MKSELSIFRPELAIGDHIFIGQSDAMNCENCNLAKHE